jgi:hypothetical protein
MKQPGHDPDDELVDLLKGAVSALSAMTADQREAHGAEFAKTHRVLAYA